MDHFPLIAHGTLVSECLGRVSLYRSSRDVKYCIDKGRTVKLGHQFVHISH